MRDFIAGFNLTALIVLLAVCIVVLIAAIFLRQDRKKKLNSILNPYLQQIDELILALTGALKDDALPLSSKMAKIQAYLPVIHKTIEYLKDVSPKHPKIMKVTEDFVKLKKLIKPHEENFENLMNSKDDLKPITRDD